MSAGYDASPVISGINLDIQPGTITAIVGPNGVGKTTLFRSLFNHGAWLDGSVLWRSVAVAHLRDRRVPRSAVSWVRQDRSVFTGLSVENALLLAGSARTRSEAVRAVGGALERFARLSHVRTQRVETLSGGEMAILSLAMGIAASPDLLCVDEPAAGLAGDTFEVVRQALRDFVAERACAVMVIEHREGFVSGLADATFEVGGPPA